MRGVCFAAATVAAAAAAGWNMAFALPNKTFLPPAGRGLADSPRAATAPTPPVAIPPTPTPPAAESTTTTPACGINCNMRLPHLSSIDWVKGIPRELVVATVVLTVNNQTNTTSTSTITNDITSLLADNTLFPPNPTNADGTIVTTVTWSGRTTVLAYPTVVGDYASSYTVAGSIIVRPPGTNTSTCSVVGGGDPKALTTVAPTPLPSHPPLELPTQRQLDGDDPRGLFSVPRWSTNDFPLDYMTSLFPDVAAFTGCLVREAAPETALDIASFLTETSTNWIREPAASLAALTGAAGEEASATPEKPGPPAQQSANQPPIPVTPTPFPQATPDQIPPPTPAADAKHHPTSAPAPAPLPGKPVPSDLVAGTNTLVPGGPAITVGGMPVSLASDGADAVVGSQTVAIPTPAAAKGAPAVVLGGATFTPPSNTANSPPKTPGGALPLVAGTDTLLPGGPAVTVAGTPISLASDGANAVVGSQTVAIPTAVAVPTGIPVIVLAGMTFTPPSNAAETPPATPAAAPDLVAGTNTLVPSGPAITVGGTPISLAPNGANAVIGTATVAIPTAATGAPALVVLAGLTFSPSPVTNPPPAAGTALPPLSGTTPGASLASAIGTGGSGTTEGMGSTGTGTGTGTAGTASVQTQTTDLRAPATTNTPATPTPHATGKTAPPTKNGAPAAAAGWTRGGPRPYYAAVALALGVGGAGWGWG